MSYRNDQGRFIARTPWAWRKGSSGNPGGRRKAVLADEAAARAAVLPTPVVEWIEANFYDPSTVVFRTAKRDYSRARLLRLEDYQKRILTHIFTPDSSGKFPYSQVVWSQVKKSGKTTIAGAVAAWFAATVESPNLVLCVANDLEQSAGRIFAAAGPSLHKLGCDWPVGKASIPEATLPNGTTIRAIPNSFATEAGSDHGLALFSELWAFNHERCRRLVEELTTIPTRVNSMLWVESYVGFANEGGVLLDLWGRIFQDLDGTALQPGVTVVPELSDITTTDGAGNERPACLSIPTERLFCFWDSTARMSWQSLDYYKQQRAALRPTTFVRLHQNRWQQSADRFIEPEWWDRSLTLDGPSDEPSIFALDASMRHDCTALVGVKRAGDLYRTTHISVWEPGGRDLDIEATAIAVVLELHERGLVEELWYDVFQLHQIGLNLRALGVAAREFSQQEERLRADAHLYRLYRDAKIQNWNHGTLAQHLRAAQVKQLDDERFRLTKPRMGAAETRRIDCVVAQSMACWRASFTQTEGGIEAPAPAWFGGGEAPERDPRYIIGAPHRDTYWHRKWARQHHCPMCFEEAKRNNPHVYD